jgi:integrase
MPKLTKSFIDGLRASNKETFFWDSEIIGFGVKIFPSGTKTFVLQYRTPEQRTRRYSIGKLSDALTPDQARKRARELLALVITGGDPQAELERRRQAWTVNELMDAYLASETFAGKAESTKSVDLGRIKRHVRPLIGTRFADKVTTEELRQMHRAISDGKTAVRAKTEKARGVAKVKGGEGTADKAVLIVRAAYSWAVEQEYLKDNPAARIKVSKSGTRSAILEDANAYARMFKTLAALESQKRIRPEAADAIRVIALTGARRSEVLRLQWAWVDLEGKRLVIPAKKNKTGRKTGEARIIGLPQAALEIILRQPRGADDDAVFRAARDGDAISLQRPWDLVRTVARIQKEMGVHGLRHSIGSHMAMSGATINEIMDVLGHRQTSTALRYIHFAEEAKARLADRAATVALTGLSKAEQSNLKGKGKE